MDRLERRGDLIAGAHQHAARAARGVVEQPDRIVRQGLQVRRARPAEAGGGEIGQQRALRRPGDHADTVRAPRLPLLLERLPRAARRARRHLGDPEGVGHRVGPGVVEELLDELVGRRVAAADPDEDERPRLAREPGREPRLGVAQHADLDLHQLARRALEPGEDVLAHARDVDPSRLGADHPSRLAQEALAVAVEEIERADVRLDPIERLDDPLRILAGVDPVEAGDADHRHLHRSERREIRGGAPQRAQRLLPGEVVDQVRIERDQHPLGHRPRRDRLRRRGRDVRRAGLAPNRHERLPAAQLQDRARHAVLEQLEVLRPHPFDRRPLRIDDVERDRPRDDHDALRRRGGGRFRLLAERDRRGEPRRREEESRGRDRRRWRQAPTGHAPPLPDESPRLR